MQVPESATVSIEPGETVGDLIAKLSAIGPSASWSSSCKIFLSFSWNREETSDEKQARETVEQKAEALKRARAELQAAQAARDSIAKVEQ